MHCGTTALLQKETSEPVLTVGGGVLVEARSCNISARLVSNQTCDGIAFIVVGAVGRPWGGSLVVNASANADGLLSAWADGWTDRKALRPLMYSYSIVDGDDEVAMGVYQ